MQAQHRITTFTYLVLLDL